MLHYHLGKPSLHIAALRIPIIKALTDWMSQHRELH
jgi:hypothetical protein